MPLRKKSGEIAKLDCFAFVTPAERHSCNVANPAAERYSHLPSDCQLGSAKQDIFKVHNLLVLANPADFGFAEVFRVWKKIRRGPL